MPIKSTQCVDIMVLDDWAAPKDCSRLLCRKAAVLRHSFCSSRRKPARVARTASTTVLLEPAQCGLSRHRNEPTLQEERFSRLFRVPRHLQPVRSRRIISHRILRGIHSNDLSRSRYIHCSFCPWPRFDHDCRPCRGARARSGTTSRSLRPNRRRVVGRRLSARDLRPAASLGRGSRGHESGSAACVPALVGVLVRPLASIGELGKSRAALRQ